jgi:signal transduction histidine kinase
MRWRLFAGLWHFFFPVAASFALSSSNTAALYLSDDQRTWIAQHPAIRVGMTPQWPPFSVFSGNGVATGIDADLLKFVSQRTGLKFDIVQADSWSEIRKMIEQGKLDMTTGTARDAERETIFNFTRAYFNSAVVIVASESILPLNRYSDVTLLRDATVAMPRDHITTKALAKRMPSAKIILKEKQSECFEAVARNQADATVVNLFAATEYLNEHPGSKLAISGAVPDFDFPLRFGVRKGEPVLAQILDNALGSITQHELDDITRQHLMFALEGARRTALERKRTSAIIAAALIILSGFVIWNFVIRKEISARRAVEAALQQTNQSLEIFSHSISHDLRSPLFAIRGFSEALKEDYEDKLDSTGKDYLNRIMSAALRMDNLIRDILAYSKVSRAELSLRTVSLQPLVKQLIEEFPPAQQQYFHIDAQLPDVRANPTLLGQCLSNLLSNAVKFVPAGKTPSVRIWGQNLGSFVKLWIEDNGIGIAPENQQRIFQMFKRINAAGYEGTGIGLAVVAKGVERMGGKVGVESEPEHGSRFWIQLCSGSPG